MRDQRDEAAAVGQRRLRQDAEGEAVLGVDDGRLGEAQAARSGQIPHAQPAVRHGHQLQPFRVQRSLARQADDGLALPAAVALEQPAVGRQRGDESCAHVGGCSAAVLVSACQLNESRPPGP